MAQELTTVKKTLKNHRIQLLDRTNVVAAGEDTKLPVAKKRPL